MIKKSTSKSRISHNISPNLNKVIEFEEICYLCNKEIPEGKLVLRHEVTRNIICLFCLIKIAEIQ